jgi:PAS domain S-box-containing protein
VTRPIRVMIGDDDRGLAAALADTVKDAAGLELLAVRHDADAIVNAAAVHRPDVILMDLKMPGGGGVAATRRITSQQPSVAVVGLSAHEDKDSAAEMLDAGAVAYLVKGMPEAEIVEAIRRASRGQLSMPAELGASMLRDTMRRLRDRTASEARLQSNEQRLETLLEAMPDGVLVIDAQHAVQAANASAHRMFGYQPGELVGHGIGILVPDRFRAAHERLVGDFHKHPRPRPMGSGLELFARRKDGSEFPVDISLNALPGSPHGAIVACVRDRSEAAVADDGRRRSERLIRGVLESAPDAMVAVDPAGRIQVVNTRTEALFGYARSELLTMSVDDLVPASMRATHATHRAQYLREPAVRPMGQGLELSGRRKDGSEFPVDISLSPMQTEGGMLVVAAVRDITDRKLAERRLAESQEAAERRRLMVHLVHAQEEERRKIAGDIHDDSIQAMTAASLRLQQLRKHMTTEQQLELLGRLDEAVRESITRLRRLMFDLRPPALDRTGLGPAVRELLDRLRSETEIDYTLDDRLASEPSPDLRIELYRILQEAVANVRKHSGARTVKVLLEAAAGGYHVGVTDDGSGFDSESRTGVAGHIGLVAMRERATIAGGRFAVESRPGRGTTVDFWLPEERPNGSPNGSPEGVSPAAARRGSAEAPR